MCHTCYSGTEKIPNALHVAFHVIYEFGFDVTVGKPRDVVYFPQFWFNLSMVADLQAANHCPSVHF